MDQQPANNAKHWQTMFAATPEQTAYNPVRKCAKRCSLSSPAVSLAIPSHKTAAPRQLKDPNSNVIPRALEFKLNTVMTSVA
jgi:hypothetical protein